jgi:hypothetical protein
MKITSEAKEALKELLDSDPNGHDAFWLSYATDQWDNKRGENGDNVFFQVRHAHWVLDTWDYKNMPDYTQKFFIEFEGFLFWPGPPNTELPNVTLHYNGINFEVDGHEVKVKNLQN